MVVYRENGKSWSDKKKKRTRFCVCVVGENGRGQRKNTIHISSYKSKDYQNKYRRLSDNILYNIYIGV